MTAPIIHGIMLQAGIMLQTGTSSATGTNATAVANQIIEQVGVPAVQVLLLVGGFALLISMLMFPIAYLIEYMLHPTSWGRSAALTEAINHIKRPIAFTLALFLGIYLSLLVAGLVSNNSKITQNASTYAAQILKAMLDEVANLFTTAVQNALKTTP
jgi:hypothetical protein